ncbi:MAG: ABC transporter permease [Candidatus Symbiobacter sp.]|nr:ABC transporter permease [Candidatus Symbiobacter sp.]
MLIYAIKRLLSLIVTLVVGTFLVFTVAEILPPHLDKNYNECKVARIKLGQFALQSQVDVLCDKLHLRDPALERYVLWLGILTGIAADPLQDPEVLKSANLQLDIDKDCTGKYFCGKQYFGNLGFSITNNTPVNNMIWDRLGNTAILAGVAFALIVPLSILFGVLAGMREGSLLDRSISFFGIVAASIPEYASGVFLVTIFVAGLGILPGSAPMTEGAGWSIWQQMVLPVTVLVIYDGAYMVRMVRGAMAEVMNSAYIRTAILKGLSMRATVMRHALRNAMIAPFTVLILQINWLISGVVVTESVFAYPGFGRMLLDASLRKDIQLIEAATLIALGVAVITQLISDLGYALLNPRIRLR